MLKLSVVLVLLACCTVYTATGRDLKKNVAVATGSVKSNGGFSSLKVTSVATSDESAKDAIIGFCYRAFNQYTFPVFYRPKKEYCKAAYSLLDVDLKAVGEAIAEAKAFTTVEASNSGYGFACGNAKASASAEAETFAKIFVEAIAIATNKFDKAEIEAAVGTEIFAKAFAAVASSSSACAGSMSSAAVSQEAFARASVKVIATVTVWLIAKVDCHGYSGFADSKITVENKRDIEAVAVTKTTAAVNGVGFAKGAGSAVSITPKKCVESYKKCCDLSITAKVCTYSMYSEQAEKKEGSNHIWFYTDMYGEKKACYC